MASISAYAASQSIFYVGNCGGAAGAAAIGAEMGGLLSFESAPYDASHSTLTHSGVFGGLFIEAKATEVRLVGVLLTFSNFDRSSIVSASAFARASFANATSFFASASSRNNLRRSSAPNGGEGVDALFAGDAAATAADVNISLRNCAT